MNSAKTAVAGRLDDLLDAIERKATSVEMQLEPAGYLTEVPKESGWYTVRTTASEAQLRPLRPRGVGHTPIEKRLKRIAPLAAMQLTAVPNADGWWPVYSGHAANLRYRANSHLEGNVRTGCLSLAQYAAQLRTTRWEFRFTPVSAVAGKLKDCEPIRILGEQLWRARFGWPVLCHR